MGLIVAAYFSLESSSGTAVAASQALAEALVLFSVSAHMWGRVCHESGVLQPLC